MAEQMQTVTFQAAKTNASPSAPVLPYHIEQGLRGEVGTTRLPADLSKRSQFLAHLIAFFNFGGILWVLWPSPIIGPILAICVCLISLSLAGLFHGIPYLEQRRSDWTATNRRLLTLCFVVSWAASAWIAYFLIFYPPTIPARFLQPTKSYSRVASEDLHNRIVSGEANQCVYEADPYRRSLCRQRAAASHITVRREVEQEATPQTNDDLFRRWATYLAAVLVLGAVHGIAAYGSPFSSEANNAIWREPYTGYAGNPAAGIPEDPATKLKKGFDHWVKSISLTGNETLSVDAVYTNYTAHLKGQPNPPPAYGLSDFKTAFKAGTGKEPIDIKGTPSYQGVSFDGGGMV